MRRLPQEVFETYRCKPFGLAEPKRWIRREKGCDVSAVRSVLRFDKPEQA
jgi:hypothetical protein